MIHLQLAGRLGNQLFQWAAALNIQKAYGAVTLVFDDYHQSNPSPILSKLVQGQIEIRKNNLLGRVLQVEDRFFSDSSILKKLIKTDIDPYCTLGEIPKKTRVLRGFYQNWENVIKSERVIADTLNRTVEQWISDSPQLRNLSTELDSFCAMHVRQGDFENTEFGLLSSDFYKTHRPHSTRPVVVFTDQDDLPEEYKSAINADYIFSPKNLSSEDSFALMSRAQELVMANSTFSWWAGFIALQNQQKVIIPDPWLKNRASGSALCFPTMIKKNSLFK